MAKTRLLLIKHNASEARLTTLLSRSERSSPKAALRCATGAGLDGEGASESTIAGAVMCVVLAIAEWQMRYGAAGEIAHVPLISLQDTGPSSAGAAI